MFSRGNKGSTNGVHELVCHRHPKSALAEAYRTLRTSLGFASPDRALRLLMVTSAGPEEGKSTTVCNLAIVLAQAGQRVLLVDCDLRKPRLHHVFNVSNLRGFTTLLLQQSPLEELVQPGPVGGLSILTSGPQPPNPAELLDSRRAHELWSALAAQFDIVLVDSSPVLAVTDAVVMAADMDGVLLVVRAANTRRDLVQDAVDQLARANARIVGTVLNRLPVHAKDYHYYHYYHNKEKAEQVQL